MREITNSHQWHIPFLGPLPLPGILPLHALMLLFASGIVLFLFLVVYRRDQRVPTGFTNCLEMFVVFIRDDVAIPNLGDQDGPLFTPMLCTIFFFILALNLLGLVPLFASATANANVTGALAFIIFILLILGTMAKGGVKGFWHALIPAGLPKFFIPFFFIIEIFSLLVRCGALMIRLFANMMVGHMIILSFLGIVVLFGWKAFPMIIMAVFSYCLELFVAFLQAYIFVLLSAIFIGQMYHPQH